MSQPLSVYRTYQDHLRAQQYDRLDEVVDLPAYTENCLGLTGWTRGFDVALQNYAKNILSAFGDQQATEIDIVEGQDALAIRSRIEATHVGEFLGVPATGRRVAWDVVAIVHVQHGRMVGQWIQPDLWGIYQQLTAPVPAAPAVADVWRGSAAGGPQAPPSWARSAG